MRGCTRRRGGAAAAALVAAWSLASCSGEDTAYCDALGSARAEWSETGDGLRDPATAARLVASVREVEAAAPAEVRADWTSLRSLFEKFTVPRPDLVALTRQMRAFESAAKRVETHARETCGLDLGG